MQIAEFHFEQLLFYVCTSSDIERISYLKMTHKTQLTYDLTTNTHVSNLVHVK